MRLILRNIQYCQSTRKQNFFELNPVYPDYGQKDFDIYNVERKRVLVFDKFMPIKKREQRVRNIIRDQFYLRKYKLKQLQKKTSSNQIDEDSGLPIGLNLTYDAFITAFKKQKRQNDKIQYQFKTLLMSLIQKFKAKSQLELIKLFRISLAHSKKKDLKQKIKGKILQDAITRATSAKNDYFTDFFTYQKIRTNDQNQKQQMNEQQLDEASFQQALKQIDSKIQNIQNQLRIKKMLKGQVDWDPVYGKKIEIKNKVNPNYDMNLKRGAKSLQIHDEIVDLKNQDQHIARRINKLFFMRKLQYLKKQSQFKFDVNDLPINLRNKQKIINQLAHKYKQQDFHIIPDLKQIYNQIDLALDKVNVRFSSDLSVKQDQLQDDIKKKQNSDTVEDITYNSDELLWNNLDVQRVFAADYYSKQNINKQMIQQKNLIHVSPSAGTQLSLNRLPFNLFRHSQCEIFNVFTKYKHMILKDYLKDMTIDPKEDFNYFNLEQAQNILKRIKKDPLSQSEKYYGHAKRKKSEAEVFLKHGTGVVTINKQSIADYFADTYHRVQALKPLIFSQTAGQYDLDFTVVGGGLHGQSQCCAYALARALMKINPKFRKIFEKVALAGHDSRAKQPKRIGLYSARVRPPYVRR